MIHPDLIITSTYAHLRSSDISLLHEAVGDRKNWDSLRDVLIQFAMESGERRAIDAEALFMLGRQLTKILPVELRRTILLNIHTMREEVRTPLSAGMNFTMQPRRRPPLKQELRRIVELLQGEPDVVFEEKVKGFHSRHLENVQRSGQDDELISATLVVARLLLRRGAGGRIRGARLAQEIVREAIVWRPSLSRLWFLWCWGLQREGAFDEAEDLLWNSIRRFPNELRFRALLNQILLCDPSRNAEGLALARENLALFGKQLSTVVAQAEALSRTGNPDDMTMGASLLCEFAAVSQGQDYRVAISTLVNILLRWADLADDFEALLPHFPSKTIAGTVALEARRADPSAPVASLILRRMVAEEPEDRLTRNTLAKTLAATGDAKDAEEAVKILRANLSVDPQDKYAVGQLVNLLRKGGEEGWRDEALQHLRRALEIRYDRALETQYAGVLSEGSQDERSEALEILERLRAADPANGHVAMALARWHLGRGTTDAPDDAARLLRPLASDPNFQHAAWALLDEAGFPRPASRTAGTEKDDVDRLWGTRDFAPGAARQPVPHELRRWGRLRRRRFLLENGLLQDEEDSVQDESVNSEELIYAKVLETRRGNAPSDDSIQGTFQVALELAVYSHDSRKLDELGRKFSRFSAVILLAKAILGDTTAQAAVNFMLMQPGSGDPIGRVIVGRLKDIGEGPLNFVDDASSIRRVIYDVNEMTLHEPLAA